MRILELLSTQFLTGPAELCLEDGERLAAAGHEVLFGADTRREGNYARIIKERGFKLMEELTLCAKPQIGEVLRDIGRLRERMHWADLVHCRFAHDHALSLAAMPGLHPRPALVRTVEIAKSLEPGFLRARSFRVCDAVIVSCQEYALKLMQDHDVPEGRVYVLPGRVDAERFSPGSGERMREELGVKPGEVLFGIVSRVKPERQHALLVRAFAHLAARRPEARLAIIGRGEYLPEIQKLVGDLALERQVIFAGYRKGEALVEAYRALDAKVWLAEGNDGTCRAVLEAMASGKPVIVGDSGAMAEYVRDGRDGFVVRLDEEAIAAALEELMDPAEREGQGRSARTRATEYTAERRAAALEAIYKAAQERSR